MKKVRKNWLSHLFDNDLFVRIISVLIAIIGWFLVATWISPEFPKTISDIPVTVKLEGSAAQKLGLQVVSGGDQTISIDVKGNRNLVGALGPNDFDVSVSPPSEVTRAGDYTLDVAVSKKDPNADFKIISWSVKSITVGFDRMVSNTYKLEPLAENASSDGDHVLGSVSASPAEITLTGTETNINRVKKCVARASINSTLSETLVTDLVDVLIYDTDGNLMDPSLFKMSTGNIKLTVPVLQQKTLNLAFKYINIPNGFNTDSIKYTMSSNTIDVAGPDNVVGPMTNLDIGYVDISKLDLGYSQTFNITLPSGFVNVNNLSTVTVTFNTSNLTSKTIRLNKSNMNLINIPPGYTASISTSYIGSVKLIGTQSDLVGITSAGIAGELDLQGLSITSPGKYTVPVSIIIPLKNSVWAVGEYTAVVSVWRQ